MLFLQGTRDALADRQVLATVLQRLSPVATSHLIEQADHSFHVPVRSGTTDRQVLDDVLDTLVAWALRICGRRPASER
jgi:predicted alpha/beta-hydrolase family hydrolase